MGEDERFWPTKFGFVPHNRRPWEEVAYPLDLQLQVHRTAKTLAKQLLSSGSRTGGVPPSVYCDCILESVDVEKFNAVANLARITIARNGCIILITSSTN
jgi:hypothetical protein